MEPLEPERRRLTGREVFGLIAIVVVGVIVLWLVLNYYIAPGDDPTQRKDLVQAFAVIVGGLVAFGTLLIGWRNLRHQQRALLVNQQNTQEVEDRRAQDSTLQSYLEQMGDLLLDKELRSSPKDSEVRILAQAQTHAVLPTLNSERKRSVLIFLYRSNLLNASEPIVDIRGAELSEVNLHAVNLQAAQLQLANLQGAILLGASLQRASLQGADLRRADLRGANLRGANLRGAQVSKEQLGTARSLKGATMPDGSVHD